jgi:cytochrome b involved in lipid metabolism
MEILMDHAGEDASAAFDSIGHSENAHVLMKKYCIGDYAVPHAKETQQTGQLKKVTASVNGQSSR